jgi:hypothetical protein
MPDRSDLAARLISPAAIACAGALLLPALLALLLPSALDGPDSVNFALGLSDFDPLLEQPHFPGYPVYIAVCRLFARAGFPEAVALALPGVLASSALVPAQSALGRRFGLPAPVLALAALLLVAQPLVWFEGPRPAPDLLATSCAWIALALAACQRPGASGLVLGLALGVRVDLAPLAFVAVAFSARARVRFASGLALGVGLWLPALALALPPGAFARGTRFALGHFSVWGSTALAGAGRSTAFRGLAFGLAAPLLPLLGFLGARWAPKELGRFLACALGPYALWVLLGQNLASPRHLLPLAPALAILAASAIASLERRAVRVLAWGALAVSALALSSLVRPPHPNGRELAGRVRSVCPGCSAIFAGPSERVLEHYSPAGAPLYQRTSLDEVRRDLAAWPELVGAIGITSELAGSESLAAKAEQIAAGLQLYRIDAAALR